MFDCYRRSVVESSEESAPAAKAIASPATRSVELNFVRQVPLVAPDKRYHWGHLVAATLFGACVVGLVGFALRP